ncbi:MAG: hypothetical protein ACHQAY_05745 [Hyphomicrobiales bacterium]
MSMKRFFKGLAILSLALGAGFASLPHAQAAPLVPSAADAATALGATLPIIAPGSNLIEARYWRYRYWRPYHRWHYRRWHYRHWHYRRWHYRRWHYRRWR